MKLSPRRHIQWNFPALAFAIPCCGMLFVMLISGYEPFGKYSMLYSDMYHQYYPFFVAFRRALRSGDSLLFSWNVGMGIDYLGLISYYLASPLNLLSVLVPEGLLLEFFSLLMPVKLGLAGAFFAIFLKKIYGKNDLSISVFGGFYGLCAWALGFQWNIMWLDTFALLPLVALGTVSLLREKKFLLYTLTLFQAIFSNYYIGFFVCIFVFLLFFVYEICRFAGWKKFFADLLRIALFSLLAIGMTAILELPALAALQTTQSSVNKFPDTFRLNIADSHTILGLLDAMRQVAGNMGGALEPNFKEGLPNLYCGVSSIFLGFLYLQSRQVRLRDKLCAVFLLVFFMVSFIIRQLDYIWHGFHFTNMIPYRFSFLFSFVLLYMAYGAWTRRKEFNTLHILGAAVLTAWILSCSNDLKEMKEVVFASWEFELPVYIIYNVSFLLLYTGLMIYGAVKTKISEDLPDEEKEDLRLAVDFRRSNARLWLLTIMCVELMAGLTSFGLYFPGTGVSNYPKGTEHAASMIRYMHEREEDTLFYRAETTHSQTLNDGALNGYNGVSAFTSSANVKVTEFMQALGYGAKNTYNRYCFEESSPVSNLFLNLKYMIERDGRERGSAYFTDVHHYGTVHLLENTAYLPLGFLAENTLADVNFNFSNGTFDFQNELFTAATGIQEDVWQYMNNASIVGVNVELTEQTAAGYCDYGNAQSGSSVTYSYIADWEGFCCIHLNLPKRNDYSVVLNGVELYRETISLPQMIAVGDMKPGDILDIRISCKAGEDSTMTVKAAMLDETAFRRGYERLAASTLELTAFSNTLVEGTVTCDRDGLLYTSIPQNGNWTAQVDGEEAEITLIGDAMVGLQLTEGAHTVTFRYRNKAFALGWKISLLCAAVLFAIAYPVYAPQFRKKATRRHGKFEK